MRYRMLLVIAAVAVNAAGSVPPSAGLRTLKVSSFGFDPVDSTHFLQRAFDADVDVVVVDRQPTDWIAGPLFLTNSNIKVILEDGVVLRAKRGAFHGRCDAFIDIPHGEGITVCGEGRATIVMNKMDYQDKNVYSHSEWRHVFRMLDARRVTLRNLTLLSSGGDAISFAGPKDVLMENLICENHHRQGISPCGAENLTVRNCVFNGTSGTAPQCGVDLEPWKKTQVLKNILFENCQFNGNAASGMLIHLPGIRESDEPVSIRFKNCTAVGNRRYGVVIYGGSRNREVRGSIEFEGCRLAANGCGAVRIVNQMTNGVQIVFRDCDIDARGSSDGQVLLFDNSQEQCDFAGVTFENCGLALDAKTKLCEFRGMTGAGIRDVKGDFIERQSGVERRLTLDSFVAKYPPHPELMREFTTGDADFTKLAGDGTKLLQPLTTPWLWRKATYIQHVPKAGEYALDFENYAYRVGQDRPLVQVRDRWGTDLGSFVLDKTHTTYTIKANDENLYRFEITMRGSNRVKVTSPYAGQGYLCKDYQAFYCYGGGGDHDAWFCVPSMAKVVKVDICAEQPAEAVLLNASGEKVAAFPYKSGRDILTIERKPADKDEFWCLRVARVQENLRYRIGGDAVPVVSQSKEAALLHRR